MAGIDASIPLSVKPMEVADPLQQAAKVYSLKAMMQNAELHPLEMEKARLGLESERLSVEQQRQTMANQKLLSDLVRDPNNLTQSQSGLPIIKPEVLSQLPYQMQQDISQKQTAAEEKAAQTKKMQQDSIKQEWEQVGPIAATVAAQYDQAVQTMGKQAADAEFMPKLKQLTAQLKQQHPNLLANVNPETANMDGVKELASHWSEYAKKQVDNSARATQAETPHERMTRQDTEMHQTALEKQGQQRLGIEGERLGIEKKKLSMETSALDPSQEKNVDYWAKVIQNGGSLPPGLARNKEGAKLVKEVMKKVAGGDVDPKTLIANQSELVGTKAGERALGTRSANVDMAVTEAQKMIPLALKASEEVKRSGIKSLNEIEQSVQKGTASPALRRFVAANNSLINIYARAINPSGVPTDSDKNHARDVLSTAFSTGDYQAAVDQLNQEMSAAKASPGAVREDMRGVITGKKSNTVHWDDLK